MSKKDFELLAKAYAEFKECKFPEVDTDNADQLMGWLVGQLGHNNKNFSIDKFERTVRKIRSQLQ